MKYTCILLLVSILATSALSSEFLMNATTWIVHDCEQFPSAYRVQATNNTIRGIISRYFISIKDGRHKKAVNMKKLFHPKLNTNKPEANVKQLLLIELRALNKAY